ncbi:MAG: SRPBCC family protein [Burkholderiaceae bacterium]|nr:SRPBCC family protein [Burkholderiaceae bacterium]
MTAPVLTWPPAADESQRGLVTVVHRVQIDVPPAAVWRYVADAAHWPAWQPDTLKVEPLPPGPQAAGSVIVQLAAVGAGSEAVRWQVMAAEPGRLWVALGESNRHWQRQVLELQPLGTAATRLTRTLSGCSRSPLARWADRWTLPRAWSRPAQDAVAALKLKLESAHAPPEVAPPPVPRWRAER